MKIDEIQSVIHDINQDLHEAEEATQTFALSFSGDGFCKQIEFLGEYIWNEDEDERKFDESKNEYEPLGPYIRREVVDLIGNLEKAKKAILESY